MIRDSALSVVVLAACVCAARADSEIHVPGDHSTIQEAIDAPETMDGDEIILTEPFYSGPGNVNVDFGGKLVTVRSQLGSPLTCVIDGGNFDRAFVFQSGESGLARVEGITLQNCEAFDLGSRGGAVICINDSSPTIANCVFVQGFGVEGGAVHLDGSSPTISNCIFQDNLATDNGGALSAVAGAAPTLINCAFTGNEVSFDDGGAVYLAGSAPTLINCTFTGNDGGNGGAVVALDGAAPMIVGCRFIQNTATNGGGVYANAGAAPLLVNCLLRGNQAGSWGGGLYLSLGNASVVNCTLLDNDAFNIGGGIYVAETGKTITNTVAWQNQDIGGIDESAQIHVASGDPAVTFCCIQDGDPGDAQVPFGGAANGNIDDDPLFDDADGRLQSASPCIDAGNNDEVPPDQPDLDDDDDLLEPIPFDIDGGARFADDPDAEDSGGGSPPFVDMGAYEIQDCAADTDGDGDVDVDDLTAVILAWGGPDPDADVNNDGIVNVDDLTAVILAWGNC